MKMHLISKLIFALLLVLITGGISLAETKAVPKPQTTKIEQNRLMYMTIFLRDGEVISFDPDSWDKRRFKEKFGIISYEKRKTWLETHWIVEWPEITTLFYSVDLINTNLERYDRDKILVVAQNGDKAEITYGGLSYGDPDGTCCPEYFIYERFDTMLDKWVDVHVPIKHIQKIVMGTNSLKLNPTTCNKFPPSYNYDPYDASALVAYDSEGAHLNCNEDSDALKNLIAKLKAQNAQLEASYKKLQDDLADAIAKKDAALKKCDGGLNLSLLGRVLFESGKADLTPAGRKLLDTVVKNLSDLTDRKIKVVGHTDNVPISPENKHIFPSNWELSTARAAAVVHYLQAGTRIDPANLEAVGRSYYEPVASNETAEGRDQNRRVEIIVY